MHDSYAQFNEIDLTGVKNITLIVGKDERLKGGDIELRTGSPDGPVLGKVSVMEKQYGFTLPSSTSKTPQSGIQDLYFVGKSADNTGPVCVVINMMFNFQESIN